MNIQAAPNALPATETTTFDTHHASSADPELTTLPATKREMWTALAVVLVSVLICLVVIPFARIPLPKVMAFIPAYESALAISDLVTAVLLFGQVSRRRSRAYLALACGYLFSAAIIVPHALTFPGVFSPTGWLGANDQTTAWLYVFWHGGFPLFALGYAFSPEEKRADSLLRKHARVVIALSTVGVIGIVVALTFLATVGRPLLPTIIQGGNFSLLISTGTSPTLFGLGALALLALWRRRRRSVLDVWMMVVMSVYLLDVLLSAIVASTRYDLGWYAGRSYLLVASCCLLIVLLFEMNRLYTRVAQMEGRYRGLLEAAPDAMVIVNDREEIVLLNAQAEKRFGHRRNQLIGQKVQTIIPAGFAERLSADKLRSTEDALAQQIETGIELQGQRKDGTSFPIEIMLSPLESEEGILVTAAIRDITARKTAEKHLSQKMDELSRSNKDLEQFSYVASHDLQEPLRMVASYMQLLSRRYKGKLDSDADEFIAFAVDGTTRMQQLIRDLLAYSRVGTGGLKLRNISSEKSLQQALVNLRGTIEASGALVTHDPLPVVLANEMLLSQLFQNLVGNAIKYQKSGTPKVHISAAANGQQQWDFSVRDNGIGIEPQNLERVFGMFQRLHKAGEFAGTGIGLAICKKIVEQHHGNISVESEPGQGSTFHFTLGDGTLD